MFKPCGTCNNSSKTVPGTLQLLEINCRETLDPGFTVNQFTSLKEQTFHASHVLPHQFHQFNKPCLSYKNMLGKNRIGIESFTKISDQLDRGNFHVC